MEAIGDGVPRRKERSLESNIAEKKRQMKIWKSSPDLVRKSLIMLPRAISVEYWDQTHIGMNWQLSLYIFQFLLLMQSQRESFKVNVSSLVLQ